MPIKRLLTALLILWAVAWYQTENAEQQCLDAGNRAETCAALVAKW